MSATPPAADVRLSSLAVELSQQFLSWTGEDWTEERFRDLALRVFELQYETNTPYRRYCAARGIEPAGMRDWRAIPPVPTAAFRRIPLRSASTPEELPAELQQVLRVLHIESERPCESKAYSGSSAGVIKES